jgi:hypothetical protein
MSKQYKYAEQSGITNYNEQFPSQEVAQPFNKFCAF